MFLHGNYCSFYIKYVQVPPEQKFQNLIFQSKIFFAIIIILILFLSIQRLLSCQYVC